LTIPALTSLVLMSGVVEVSLAVPDFTPILYNNLIPNTTAGSASPFAIREIEGLPSTFASVRVIL